MNKNMKKYIDKENQKIYKQLYTDYVIGLKKLNENLMRRGLMNSGVSENITFDFVRGLLIETVDKLEKTLDEAQQKFKRKMSQRDVKYYIDGSIETTYQYINNIEKEIYDMFEKRFPKRLSPSESLELSFNNLRTNISIKIKDMGETIILLNTGTKVDTNIKISVIGVWIGIVGVIATIILGLLSLR